MATTLVLIRHGKAQRRDGICPDEQRTLTKAGRRALKAWLPRSRALLEADGALNGTVEVWSSPAIRAKQTAKAAAKCWGLPKPIEHGCLWRQDADAFLREAAASPADAVVAAGHNPFMEELLAQVSGARLDLATGAVAAVRVGADDVPARLLWLVQGPQSQRWQPLIAMEDVLSAWIDAVAERRETFLANPDDEEALHKFRVSIRTTRSLLTFMAPFQSKDQNRQMQRDLRAIVLETSRLRELDVLGHQVEEIELPAMDLEAAVVSAREAERDRTVEALSGKALAKAMRRVRKAGRAVVWRASVERNGLTPERLQARFAAMLAKVERGRTLAEYVDEDGTHRLRKDAKRVRYVAENLGELLGEAAVGQAARMVEVQDELGALCDARVNSAILSEFPTQGLSVEAVGDLDELRERNDAYVREFLGARASVR